MTKKKLNAQPAENNGATLNTKQPNIEEINKKIDLKLRGLKGIVTKDIKKKVSSFIELAEYKIDNRLNTIEKASLEVGELQDNLINLKTTLLHNTKTNFEQMFMLNKKLEDHKKADNKPLILELEHNVNILLAKKDNNESLQNQIYKLTTLTKKHTGDIDKIDSQQAKLIEELKSKKWYYYLNPINWFK